VLCSTLGLMEALVIGLQPAGWLLLPKDCARLRTRSEVGSAQTLVDGLFGGSCCDSERGVADGGLELHGSELAERALAAAPVVGAFDPGDDRQVELFA
jgi:hypothetical protein